MEGKRFLLISASFIVALTLVLSLGCKAAVEEPAVTEPEEVTTEEAPAEVPAEEVTINIIGMAQAGMTPEEMQEIIARFEGDHPGVKVNVTFVAYDALHDKLVTSISGDQPAYDAVLVDDIWYAKFAEAGWLLDVTDKITPEMREGVFEAAWDVTTYKGKVWGMPWLLDQKYFFYNHRMLQEAGIAAPPSTWEELVEQGKILKEKGIVEYPIIWSWGQFEAAICDLVTLIYGNGGEFFDAENKPVFNDERGVEALAWMVESIKNGISNPGSITSVEEDVRNVFSQGKAAFATNWVYMYELTQDPKESNVVGEVSMALMPVFERGKDEGIASATINGSMGYSVTAKSANKEVAWQFLEYLTSREIQEEFSAHMLPIWKASFEDPALVEKNPVTTPMFEEQFPYAHVRPKVPYYTEASKAIQLAMQEALTGQKSPQQAFDDAVAKILEME